MGVGGDATRRDGKEGGTANARDKTLGVRKASQSEVEEGGEVVWEGGEGR